MAEMDKFDKHMAKPAKVELGGDGEERDVFTLYPLGYEYMPKIFKLLKSTTSLASSMKGVTLDTDLSELSKEQMDTLFSLFDEETITLIGELTMATLRASYPDQFKDDAGREKMKKFVAANLFELFTPIIELNMPTEADAKKIKQLSDELEQNESTGKSKSFGAQKH